MRITSFIVQGKGPFPFDMLRYDQAWPRDTQSASNLQAPEDRTERACVRSVHLNTSRRVDPTFARWVSFGWTVTECFDQDFNPVFPRR